MQIQICSVVCNLCGELIVIDGDISRNGALYLLLSHLSASVAWREHRSYKLSFWNSCLEGKERRGKVRPRWTGDDHELRRGRVTDGRNGIENCLCSSVYEEIVYIFLFSEVSAHSQSCTFPVVQQGICWRFGHRQIAVILYGIAIRIRTGHVPALRSLHSFSSPPLTYTTPPVPPYILSRSHGQFKYLCIPYQPPNEHSYINVISFIFASIF